MSYSSEYEGKVVESENSSPVLVTPELEVQVSIAELEESEKLSIWRLGLLY